METQSKILSARSHLPFDQCVSMLRQSIKQSGLEIVAELAVHREIRSKLGLRLPRYTILMVWEPLIAYQALTAETESPYFTLFNFTVAEDGPHSIVMAPRTSMLSCDSNSIGVNLMARTIGNKTEEALARVADMRLPVRDQEDNLHPSSWVRRSAQFALRIVSRGTK